MNYPVFASESVCAGHPDKICDQISDAILDSAISKDPRSRVAVETLVTKNHVTIAGEITCPKKLNYEKIIRQVIKSLDYTNPEYGFTDQSPIDLFIHQQSPDIAQGVDTGGAGDQGMMFGYAVNETEEFMPLPIAIAHGLAEKIDQVRNKTLLYLRPDGKSEVSVRYEKGKPAGIDHIVLAVPCDPKTSKGALFADLYKHVIIPVLSEFKQKIPPQRSIIVNGTGRWEIGGPASDTGVTGRKIVVDTYGGMARIGGGCFSGKDVTKVDRSAAYATRYIAKNIVAAGLATRCEVQVAYAIGYKDPIAKAVETFGTETRSAKTIEAFAWELLDLSTQGIIDTLNLRQPIYRQTARYGHFGHREYPWEAVRM